MKHLFEDLFRVETPLGPATTPTEFQENQYRKTYTNFYDDNNFLSSEVINLHPSSILGRRGSGKTAVLYHLSYNGGYSVVCKLESRKSFTAVAEEIEERLGGSNSAAAALVENCAQIWRSIIITTVICEVFDKYQKDPKEQGSAELEIIEGFLKAHGILNLRLYHRIWKMIVGTFETVAKLKYNVGEKFDFLSDFVDGYFREEGKFDEAWNAAIGLLRKADGRALVLIDSLEQFPIHRSDMQRSLAGLLHFVGELDRSFSPVKVCICFPAELHEELVRISDNPEKDFERVITLHWDTSELFRLSAHRLDFSRSVVKRDFGNLTDLAEDASREDIWAYWRRALPESIENRYGLLEDTIPYITRHTQLLPRHLIELLNNIFTLSIKGRSEPFSVGPEEVVQGVRIGEQIVCLGVIDGFKQKYPLARELINLIIPNLPNQFRYEKLAEVNRDSGFGIERDTSEIVDMFIRMGIFGRFDYPTGRYDYYRFDYTYNGQMPYSLDDWFGIHPAFSGQFKKLADRPEGTKPVYPIEHFTGKRPGVGRLGF